MKNSYAVKIFSLLVLFFISCSEEELKLEVYSPEAFAFQIDEEWELNASAQVKGFTQIEEESNNSEEFYYKKESNGQKTEVAYQNDGTLYISKFSYYANLITPSGEMLEEVDYGIVDKKSAEELMDAQLEIQIILDSSFAQGEYILQIFVLDDFSEQEDSTSVNFTLSE